MIKKTGTYRGKSNKIGGGGRFAQVVNAIEKKGVSAKRAKAIAASAGRKKYGKKRFQKMAATGKRRADK